MLPWHTIQCDSGSTSHRKTFCSVSGSKSGRNVYIPTNDRRSDQKGKFNIKFHPRSISQYGSGTTLSILECFLFPFWQFRHRYRAATDEFRRISWRGPTSTFEHLGRCSVHFLVVSHPTDNHRCGHKHMVRIKLCLGTFFDMVPQRLSIISERFTRLPQEGEFGISTVICRFDDKNQYTM